MADHDSTSIIDDDENLLRPDFKAELTLEQVEKIDSNARDLGIRRARRLSLFVLTRDAEQLIEGFGKDPEEIDTESDPLIAAIEAIEDYREHLQGMLHATESAQARMLWVAHHIAQGESPAP